MNIYLLIFMLKYQKVLIFIMLGDRLMLGLTLNCFDRLLAIADSDDIEVF